ncbi:hypothetical protein BA190_10120 [Labrys sp. WJW]|uniref:gpW family head-tail joining protein n=1 Tax=Labrys sp. WJW TaxID=1737983 RepID=UPI000836387B|nr:gpW family head-tail joining protein [Labrys sp. WJW]OCC05249.1 hypothetical protein BA190_10120 [Labrys sp. WJW]
MRTEAELRSLIAKAWAAYHQFMIGEGVEELRIGDQSTKFWKANPDKLLAYIRQLEAELARLTGGDARGAIGVVW